MKEDKNLSKSLYTNFADTVQAIINRSCIIEYGIVKEIVSKGIVQVEISAASDNADIKLVTCVLANIASDNFTLEVEPIEGDKVIVFFPRRYNDDMFDVEQDEVIVTKNTSGYNIMSGIAFLFNQCKTKSYKNLIQAAQGELKILFGYNKDEDKNYIEMYAAKDGSMELKNPKATIEVSKEGTIKAKGPKTSITLKDDGSISIDSGMATIKIDTTGKIELDAKAGTVSIKNTATSLKAVLDSILTNLTTLTTTGTAAAQTVSPATIALLNTDKATLATLLS